MTWHGTRIAIIVRLSATTTIIGMAMMLQTAVMATGTGRSRYFMQCVEPPGSD